MALAEDYLKYCTAHVLATCRCLDEGGWGREGHARGRGQWSRVIMIASGTYLIFIEGGEEAEMASMSVYHIFAGNTRTLRNGE